MLSDTKHLREIGQEIFDLSTTQSLLNWDLQTQMPPGGAEGRGSQQAALARIIHARSTSPALGELVERLAQHMGALDPESDEACLIRVMHKEYDRNRRIDARWVEEYQQVTAQAIVAWRRAREQSSFENFLPWVERVFSLARQYAAFFEPYEHVYDPLLDAYEPGMKTREVQAIFNALRPQQVELVQQVAGRPAVDNEFLYQDFPEVQQREVSRDVVTLLGYDWNRGRMEVSAHPFTSAFGIGDVRFTTRFDGRDLGMALFASMHECGHALYEQGVAPSLARTALARGASAAFHESQSRLYENLVGRSLPFWRFYYPRLQAVFPAQLGNVSLEAFYRGINRVKPSLNRVQSDEATYNLHIMLRMELEIALLEGTLQAADLPAAWDERMRSYLGVTPPDAASGALQDIHWSMGLVGYFPTYALGNLVAAQLWDKINGEVPDLSEQLAGGHFDLLLAWLQENVHRWGGKLEPQALMEKITGSRIDPAPYMRYLQDKYGELYGIV